MKGSTTIPSKVNQQAQIEKTKKTKSKPVYYPYIEHYILILKILFAGGKNRNKIFESVKENKDSKIPYQSGKVVTIDAINDLLKYELVKEIVVPIQKKSRRRYGKRKKPTIQKKIIELTRLGYELSNLIHFIDDYRDKYAYLKEKINYHFDIYSDNKTDIASAVRRHRLEQRGWNDEQIINYDKLEEGIFILESHLPLVTLTALLARYLSIMFQYNPLNDIAKEILRKVVMDAISRNILDRLNGILADKVSSSKSERENAFDMTYTLLSGWTISHIDNHIDTFSENRFIHNESLELVKTLYNILNPRDDFLQKAFERRAKSDPKINQLIEELETSRKNL